MSLLIINYDAISFFYNQNALYQSNILMMRADCIAMMMECLYILCAIIKQSCDSQINRIKA